MDNNFTDNNNENGIGHSSQHSDYSAPEPYDADAQYGFSSAGTRDNTQNPYGQQTSDPYGQQSQNPNAGGYNLNGQYYTNSSGSYNAGTNAGAGGYQYGGSSANGNYGNGMNFGQPPLDKKGRLVPNNFSMKLTFAIIEMVVSALSMSVLGKSGCLGACSMILAIIATVYVCLQNKEYNAHNWDSFISRRKVSNVLLWVSFGILMAWVLLTIIGIILLLAGVKAFADYLRFTPNPGVDLSNGYHSDYDDYDNGLDDDTNDFLDDIDDLLDDLDEDDHDHDDHGNAGDTSGASIEDTKGERVADVKGFETFTFAGKKISLPVSCKEFCAAGFTLGEDADKKLKAGEDHGYPYYDSDGDYRGTVFIYNTTNKKIKVKDGIIGGLTISGEYGEDDLELVGGLRFDSTLEECIEVFGNKVTDENIGDGYNSCSWWFEKGGYSTSIQLEFDSDGEVSSVWIMNTQDLQ